MGLLGSILAGAVKVGVGVAKVGVGVAKIGLEMASEAQSDYNSKREKFSDSRRYSDNKLDDIRRDTSRSMAERAAANKVYKERNGLE